MMASPSTDRTFAAALALIAAITVLPAPAAARQRQHPRDHAVKRSAPPPVEAQSQPPLDDLYRRRGYGVGGLVFGGDTAMAGACADLRFAQPASCGRGYGIYGNGLGTGFGF